MTTKNIKELLKSGEYPYLDKYTNEVKDMPRQLVGRDKEIDTILAAMLRPELSNVMLLADAGSGKTALVQGCKMRDSGRIYLEVDLSRMVASTSNDINEVGNMLKQLFAETIEFRRETNVEVVLFMDEFHQIVQVSPMAVEAMKPLLADSGTRGVKVIAATTLVEFRDYISSNQPLVERFVRINVPEPDKKMTIDILKGVAKTYGVENQFYNDYIYELIYEYTNRYIPANSQPRKSILVLDAMVGWHRSKGYQLNKKLLADVIYESEGVNVAFRVDGTTIKQELDKKVFAQDLATSTIEQRLQICVADLNNKTKPMSTMIFAGATGVGKGLTNDTVVPVYTLDGSVNEKLNGDLEVGDYVFNRLGQPVKVVGVFPRGEQDIYKVSLADGRVLYTDSSHLWTYLTEKGKHTMNTYTNSTKELYDRGIYRKSNDGRKHLKYYIPMNKATEYPEAKLSVHPYVMGAMIGNGCLTINALTFSSNDECVVERIASLLGDCSFKKNSIRNFNWTFPLIEPKGNIKNKQTKDVFGEYFEIVGKKSPEKRIPKAFMFSSVEQRWNLIKGLFDTDGSIGSKDGGRYNVLYHTTSKGLAEDIQQVLYSLGVASSITVSRYVENNSNNGNYIQYCLHIKSPNELKYRFFWLPRKLEIAKQAGVLGAKNNKKKNKNYEWVAIRDIELMSYKKETTCIYVDDEEHLYQAGQFVVTHNTEVCKQLANILFEDQRALIRFDMTEYVIDESVERFRDELSSAIWMRPYSIVLLDEIEKASPAVTRLLLSVLDDGRLIDRNNREVSFHNAYIIMTTNAGSEIFKNIAQYNTSDTGSGEEIRRYEKLIRRALTTSTGGDKFPVELLGRIDCIVPFQPLSENTMKKICERHLVTLKKNVFDKHNIKVSFDKNVVRYIVEDNMDTDTESGGARRILNKIESEITAEVAKFINKNPNIENIGVKVEGTLAADDKYKLQSDAYIKVVAISK